MPCSHSYRIPAAFRATDRISFLRSKARSGSGFEPCSGKWCAQSSGKAARIFTAAWPGARISGLPRQFSRWPWNSRPWASASIPWFLSPGRRGNREPPIIPAITPFCGSPNRRGIFLPDTPSPVTICETGQWWTPAAIFFLFSMEARAERRKPMRMPCRNRGSGWYMIRKPGGCIPGPTRSPSHPFLIHFLYRKFAYPHFET